MWPADSARRGRRSPSDPRDRDRKRKREKEHTKDEKRDDKREDKRDEKRDDKRDKHEKQEKHAKRDGHQDRGSGDNRKRVEYGYNDGYARGDERRHSDPHVSSRGHDTRDSNRSGRDAHPRPDDGRSARREGEHRQDKDKEKEKEKQKEKEKERNDKVEVIPPIEEPVVEPASKASKKDWREEMGGEDERDLSDDEDATERKLAEARKKRAEIMAKAKMAKETKEKEDGEVDDSQGPAKVASAANGDDADSGSDTGAVEREAKDGASKEQNEEVVKFMLEQRKNEEKQAQGDMFGETADAQLNIAADRRQAAAIGLTGASGDDWDDVDGYYCAKIGEVMDDRYLVVENICGKGVFSNVVKCKDQVDKSNGMVAIKVMRANDMMKKAAEKEIEILQILNNADKGNKRHVIRLLSTFYYRKHLCLVFECMSDDLRAALKKYTKNKGVALQAIRAYTKQLMIGLRHIHKCGIIHADIKPDNILISEGHNMVKFCDLGTALELKDVAVSPYLVSRFYRAPEIILGCEYTISVDVFALGATLYELFTGKILLNSKTNNESLKKIMELKGKIPARVIKKGMLWKTHFDDNLDFKYQDVDKYTKQETVRTITDLTAKKDMFEMLMERVGPEKKASQDREDLKTVTRVKQFADLLNQMLTIDPEKRITANDALSHPFLEDRLGGGGASKEGGDRGGAPVKR